MDAQSSTGARQLTAGRPRLCRPVAGLDRAVQDSLFRTAGAEPGTRGQALVTGGQVGEQPAGLTEDRTPRPDRVAERRPVHIRPASARDAAAVRLLIAELTPLSQHRRFFARGAPPPALLGRALNHPPPRPGVLPALVGPPVGGPPIG